MKKSPTLFFTVALFLLLPHLWSPPEGVPGSSLGSLGAQEVYSELHSADHLKIFSEVSDSLICQCGCNFILSSCPHVECPWGIPVRRFVEEQIRAGADSEEILAGFESGFGSALMDRSPVAADLLQQGRLELVSQLKAGYGPAISAKASPWGYLLILPPFLIIALLLLKYWLSRNRQPLPLKLSKDRAKAEKGMERLGDLDR